MDDEGGEAIDGAAYEDWDENLEWNGQMKERNCTETKTITKRREEEKRSKEGI